MARADSHRPLTVEAQVRYQTKSCGICGRQGCLETGFRVSTSAFPRQHFSTNAAYSIFHLSPTLYNRGDYDTSRARHYCVASNLPIRNVEVVYMNTRLTLNGVLKDFVQKGDIAFWI
jgi:hypothetical protein